MLIECSTCIRSIQCRLCIIKFLHMCIVSCQSCKRFTLHFVYFASAAVAVVPSQCASMPVVGVGDCSLQANSKLKLFGLVWWSAAKWCYSQWLRHYESSISIVVIISINGINIMAWCCCRLRVVQEKEQLLRELRNARSATEAEVVRCRIRQLEHDLQQHVVDYNSHQFDTDRCDTVQWPLHSTVSVLLLSHRVSSLWLSAMTFASSLFENWSWLCPTVM